MAANLRKVLEQARAFEGESRANFRRFVEWLGTREGEGVREGESPWAEEGEENVKVMTIHKAKGLEFPVVFLANLASERRRRQEFIPLRLQGTFEMRIGNFQTGGLCIRPGAGKGQDGGGRSKTVLRRRHPGQGLLGPPPLLGEKGTRILQPPRREVARL